MGSDRMTYDDMLKYLERISWRGTKLGLSRVTELLSKLGDPQKKLKFIHAAGTNGKGCVCAMLASVLRAAGYRTGLFTSPYLQRFNECMQLDGIPIGDDCLSALIGRIAAVADKMQDPCTEFEVTTAAALLWFAEDGCDIVVLESGLGGRLDATNIIPSSECDLISSISMDHASILGDTLEQIAYEKAGILKAERCISFQQPPEVTTILKTQAKAKGVKLSFSDFGKLTCVDNGVEGQKFHYGIGPEYELPLMGEQQRLNAALVLDAVEILRGRGWKIEDDAVTYGFRSLKWPGRFEVISKKPLVVADVAHNPASIQTVADNLLTYFPSEWRVILFGVYGDKDWQSMVDILAPLANAFVVVPPDSPRALRPQALCEALNKYGKHAIARENVDDGVRTALNLSGANGMVCVTGSQRLVGQVRRGFGLL